MTQATHEQLILSATQDLTKLLQSKITGAILAPIDASTREQLKLLAELFSRQHNQELSTDEQLMVLLPKSKMTPMPNVKQKSTCYLIYY